MFNYQVMVHKMNITANIPDQPIHAACWAVIPWDIQVQKGTSIAPMIKERNSAT